MKNSQVLRGIAHSSKRLLLAGIASLAIGAGAANAQTDFPAFDICAPIDTAFQASLEQIPQELQTPAITLTEAQYVALASSDEFIRSTGSYYDVNLWWQERFGYSDGFQSRGQDIVGLILDLFNQSPAFGYISGYASAISAMADKASMDGVERDPEIVARTQFNMLYGPQDIDYSVNGRDRTTNLDRTILEIENFLRDYYVYETLDPAYLLPEPARQTFLDDVNRLLDMIKAVKEDVSIGIAITEYRPLANSIEEAEQMALAALNSQSVPSLTPCSDLTAVSLRWLLSLIA